MNLEYASFPEFMGEPFPKIMKQNGCYCFITLTIWRLFNNAGCKSHYLILKLSFSREVRYSVWKRSSIACEQGLLGVGEEGGGARAFENTSILKQQTVSLLIFFGGGRGGVRASSFSLTSTFKIACSHPCSFFFVFTISIQTFVFLDKVNSPIPLSVRITGRGNKGKSITVLVVERKLSILKYFRSYLLHHNN